MASVFPETCHLEEICLCPGEEYDIHALTMYEEGIVDIEWRELPINKVYWNRSVGSIKKLYDHVSDQIIEVRILELQDKEGNLCKCLAPYAYIEQFEAISLPVNVFFEKVDSFIVNWTYKSRNITATS